jgi:uncharacterized protein YvpB
MSRKTKILIGLLIGFILIGLYFFILPPRVISVVPSNGNDSVALNSSLIIKFNRPIERRELQHSITPEAYGEWKFEDSLIENHLFRTTVFTPAVDLEPNTQYHVELEGISNPLGIGLSNEFSFGFKTQEKIEIVKPIGFEEEPKITLLDIPLDWQDYSLSCEAASLKMALAFKKVGVSEDEIMRKIGYDLTPRKDDIWGDPYQVYVGDIKGKICETGYGVYWEPVAKAASNWREAESFSNWGIEELIRELQSSNPVVFWGTLPDKALNDCSWHTSEGKYVKAFKEAHVRLIVGFISENGNPSKIIINDPLSGRLYWPVSYFLTNWEAFDYSGVVIR